MTPEALEGDVFTLEEEIERLKAELDVRVGVQQALGQENNQLRAENDRLKGEQRLNEPDFTRLKAENARLRAEARANLLGRDAYKEETKHLSMLNASQEAANTLLKTAIDELKAEIERLKAELGVRVGVQQALGQDNNRLKVENERLTDMLQGPASREFARLSMLNSSQATANRLLCGVIDELKAERDAWKAAAEHLSNLSGYDEIGWEFDRSSCPLTAARALDKDPT